MIKNQISLHEIIRSIRKYSYVIIISIIIMALASVILSAFMPKKYRTSATMLLGVSEDYSAPKQDGITYNDIMLNQKLIETYSEFIKSRTVIDEVIKQLNINLSYDSLRSMLSVSRLRNSEMLMIAVTDTDPIRAKDIANTTVDIFREKIADALKIDNVQVVDYAIVHQKPISPQTKTNLLIGLVLGFIISFCIILILQLLDTNIKSPGDVEEFTGLPVLGIIPIEEVKEKQ